MVAQRLQRDGGVARAYPFPTIILTSFPIPSAPSAAAVNDVAMEKKYTVPPSLQHRIDASSVPPTFTQFTTRSASSGSASGTALSTASASRASATTTRSA